jgi:hypothetical protein
MQKPVVFNRHLNKKWKEKENDIMIKKLSQAKPQINMKCPESFEFYKTQFKATPQVNINTLKEFELNKNNQILVEKIMNIFNNNQNKKKKLNSTNRVKNKTLPQNRKWDLFKITQENQHLLKRLNERRSLYNARSWEKDYEQSQNYKKNICMFPSINFYNPRENDRYIANNLSSTKTSLYNKLKNANLKISTQDNFFNTHTTFKDGEFNNVTNFNQGKKNLYTKNVFLGDLSHSTVSFSVEEKK